MTTTTYYNLNIVEGTDIVNPLTVDNPNYEKIDEVLHDNAVSGVTLATEITNATIHALTRENSDCSVIRFIATSQWKAGDSVTVDGVPVLALLPSGETLPDGAYVINANVLCVLTGTNLTVYLGSKKAGNASEIAYNDTNVEGALNALNDSMVTVNSDLSTLTSNVSTLTSNVSTLTSNLGMKLLWENHNPYSSFDAKTVELSSNDYDFVDIYYRFFASESTESGRIIASKRILNGSNSRLDYISYSGEVLLDERHVNCQIIGKVTFGNANRNSTTRNDILIPYKIYGGKFN